MKSPIAPIFLCVVLVTVGADARAQSAPETPAPPASTAAPSTPAPAPARGVGVLAIGSVRDEAFALGRAVYGSRLRPKGLDEKHARVLAGDPPASDAAADVRELAELRAEISGDDAKTRKLLSGMARDFGLEAILVVEADAPAPEATPESRRVSARLFLAGTGAFDAARYAPTSAPGAQAWNAVVESVEGRLGLPPRAHPGAQVGTNPLGPTQALPPPTKPSDEQSRPFYASAWFWAAIGGAALVGTGIYFASRDTGDDTMHLQMRVPR